MSARAIGYGRKSFDDPDQRTSSVDDQRMFAAAYAERHGFELVAFHGDNGITGATMERPSLQAMLQAVMRGEAIRIDELSRRALDGIRERLLTPEIIGRFATQLQLITLLSPQHRRGQKTAAPEPECCRVCSGEEVVIASIPPVTNVSTPTAASTLRRPLPRTYSPIMMKM